MIKYVLSSCWRNSKTSNVLEALWVCSFIGCIVEQKPPIMEARRTFIILCLMKQQQ